MDVPPSWLVRPREALYDLDNIQLHNLAPEDSSVEAIFELDYLVVEGHSRDGNTQAPPRGVQLQLTNSNGIPIDDTQVAANLGYFQFKAKPGVFKLEIRPGRGRTIFDMESVGNEGWDSLSVADVGNEITLTSFEGLTLYPRLWRLPGMETADVLAELEEPKTQSAGFFEGIMSKYVHSCASFHSTFIYFPSIKSLFDPKGDVSPIKPDQADINIFTVASGLLYEVNHISPVGVFRHIEPCQQRFVSIMILSVLRNTNSTVKFWFIENFLSPSFLVITRLSVCNHIIMCRNRNSSHTWQKLTISSTNWSPTNGRRGFVLKRRNNALSGLIKFCFSMFSSLWI